jgi:hypothetical protein
MRQAPVYRPGLGGWVEASTLYLSCCSTVVPQYLETSLRAWRSTRIDSIIFLPSSSRALAPRPAGIFNWTCVTAPCASSCARPTLLVVVASPERRMLRATTARPQLARLRGKQRVRRPGRRRGSALRRRNDNRANAGTTSGHRRGPDARQRRTDGLTRVPRQAPEGRRRCDGGSWRRAALLPVGWLPTTAPAAASARLRGTLPEPRGRRDTSSTGLFFASGHAHSTRSNPRRPTGVLHEVGQSAVGDHGGSRWSR